MMNRISDSVSSSTQLESQAQATTDSAPEEKPFNQQLTDARQKLQDRHAFQQTFNGLTSRTFNLGCRDITDAESLSERISQQLPDRHQQASSGQNQRSDKDRLMTNLKQIFNQSTDRNDQEWTSTDVPMDWSWINAGYNGNFIPYLTIALPESGTPDFRALAEQIAEQLRKVDKVFNIIRIRLNPRELGNVNLLLQAREGRVDVSIFVDPDKQADFTANLDELVKNLEENGIAIGELQVFINSQTQQGSGYTANSEQPRSSFTSEDGISNFEHAIMNSERWASPLDGDVFELI